MKEKLSAIIERFKPQQCPYCGERCISFGKRVQAANRWREPKCPQCGVVLRTGGKYFIVKCTVMAVIVVVFVLLTLYTDAYLISGWELFLVASASAAETVGVLFAPLDYEETWKYPKPASEDNNDKNE